MSLLVANNAWFSKTYYASFISCILIDFCTNVFRFHSYTLDLCPIHRMMLEDLIDFINCTYSFIWSMCTSFINSLFYVTGSKRFYYRVIVVFSWFLRGSINVEELTANHLLEYSSLFKENYRGTCIHTY